MNAGPAGSRTLADWLSLAAGLALAAVGVVVILRPETAILRLATLGFSGWLVYAIGAVQIAAGAALPFRPTRRAAAVVLVIMGFGRGMAELAYRDTDAALEAMAQTVLAAAVLGLGARRP